jgi:hypothetical protein
MNTPEKIAATYLRLNGFLLLSHFTVFIAGDQHNHVDLIGYRPGNSKELVSNNPNCALERDEDFSNTIKGLQNGDFGDSSAGIIVQVRGNNRKHPKFSGKHDDYIANFLGIKPVRIIFRCQNDKISIKQLNNKPCICISLEYSYKWIQDRIDWTRKAGSWVLSEEFLADLLFIHYKVLS